MIDRAKLARAAVRSGPYQVVPGDLLSFEMPQIIRAVSPDITEAPGTFVCRVQDSGFIHLPQIEALKVGGRTLGEVEQQIVSAYHPQYVIRRPSVVARIDTYATAKVVVLGAVMNPGVYELRSDERSLVGLLQKAGGNLRDGVGMVRIYSQDAGEADDHLLPINGLDFGFVDVALHGGETVEVAQLDPQIFTVMGLVNIQGSFAYPKGVKYNLAQALGFAGGIDDIADPKYLKIYRQDVSGKIVSAVFRIGAQHTADMYSVTIRPGDVIALDHTARTFTRKTLAQIIRIQAGLTYGTRLSGSQN